jgi:hypothetical protein
MSTSLLTRRATASSSAPLVGSLSLSELLPCEPPELPPELSELPELPAVSSAGSLLHAGSTSTPLIANFHPNCDIVTSKRL